MSPEFPFIASGALLLIGGTARNKGFPKDTIKSLTGTAALALVASATANTPVAPMVRAIGLLYLLTVIVATVRIMDESKKKKRK